MSVNMSSHAALHDGATVGESSRPAVEVRTDETKAAFKTTEFIVYLVAVVGVLLASNLVGDTDGRGDVFLADKACSTSRCSRSATWSAVGWPSPAAGTTTPPDRYSRRGRDYRRPVHVCILAVKCQPAGGTLARALREPVGVSVPR